MFRQISHVVFILALALIATSCGTPDSASKQAVVQDRAGDEAAIRAQIAANQAAGNKRDFEGVAATYTPDGDLMRLAGARVSGRAAIGQMIQEAMATTPSTSQNKFTVDNIRFLTAEVALVESTLRFDEGPLGEERGTLVMVRQDGTWLIAAARVLPSQQR